MWLLVLFCIGLWKSSRLYWSILYELVEDCIVVYFDWWFWFEVVDYF